MKTYKLYSKMTWLDEEIKRDLESPGRNPKSELFYETLMFIKKAQENGLITDEIYSTLNSWKGCGSPAYGYYHANIHYDLYKCDVEQRDELDERILNFIKVSNKNNLKESWFEDNFPFTFAYYLRRINEKESNSDNPIETINELGNKKEKKIVEQFLKALHR